MVQTFETIAANNNWYFEYGRADFHNLDKVSEKEFYLFLDPLEQEVFFDETNSPTFFRYSGRLLVLKKSEFDRVYHNQEGKTSDQGRYALYIEKCKEEIFKLPDLLRCENFDIKHWKMTEVINLFDENFDGILLNFSAEKEV